MDKTNPKDSMHPQQYSTLNNVHVQWCGNAEAFFFLDKSMTRIRLFNTDHWKQYVELKHHHPWSPKCARCKRKYSTYLSSSGIEIFCDCEDLLKRKIKPVDIHRQLELLRIDVERLEKKVNRLIEAKNE